MYLSLPFQIGMAFLKAPFSRAFQGVRRAAYMIILPLVKGPVWQRISAAENLQREDLSVIETIEAIV